MVITWSVALILIVVAQLATRKVQLVPSGLQNFMEWLVEDRPWAVLGATTLVLFLLLRLIKTQTRRLNT